MEYEIGKLAEFLNKTNQKEDKEEKNIKRKKKKHGDKIDQNENVFKTKDFIPSTSVQSLNTQSCIQEEKVCSRNELLKSTKGKKLKNKRKKGRSLNDEVKAVGEENKFSDLKKESNLKKSKERIPFVHFEEDEDDLTQDNKNRKKRHWKTLEDEEKEKRTIFVGNLPITFNKQKIKSFFRSIGDIESIRIRCAAPIKLTLPKKVAVIKNLYHPEITSYNCYVVFKTEEMALEALKLNGTKIQENHIRVDRANFKQQHDYRKSVFVGNLPYNIQDEELWKFFQACGEVANVRVIRDRDTRIGKGFGYILFKSVDSANRAIKMDGKELKERPLRISRATRNEDEKPQRNKNFVQKRGGSWRFQGMTAIEKQKIKKKKKEIKLKIQQKQKKQIAQKLQSKVK